MYMYMYVHVHVHLCGYVHVWGSLTYFLKSSLHFFHRINRSNSQIFSFSTFILFVINIIPFLMWEHIFMRWIRQSIIWFTGSIIIKYIILKLNIIIISPLFKLRGKCTSVYFYYLNSVVYWFPLQVEEWLHTYQVTSHEGHMTRRGGMTTYISSSFTWRSCNSIITLLNFTTKW